MTGACSHPVRTLLGSPVVAGCLARVQGALSDGQGRA
jgi:hypothetical protein